MPPDCNVNVVAPIVENCPVMALSMAVVLVSMPTKAMIPMAMINAVRTARNKLPRKADKAMPMPSANKGEISRVPMDFIETKVPKLWTCTQFPFRPTASLKRQSVQSVPGPESTDYPWLQNLVIFLKISVIKNPQKNAPFVRN